MKRIDAIRARLDKWNDPETTTDQKLEEGVVNEWLDYSDSDAYWLLTSLDELLKKSRGFIEEVDTQVDTAVLRLDAEGYFRHMRELRAAIHEIETAVEADRPPGKK